MFGSPACSAESVAAADSNVRGAFERSDEHPNQLPINAKVASQQQSRTRLIVSPEFHQQKLFATHNH
jgi:hypothetical protein